MFTGKHHVIIADLHVLFNDILIKRLLEYGRYAGHKVIGSDLLPFPVNSSASFTSNPAGKLNWTDNLHSFGRATIELLLPET